MTRPDLVEAAREAGDAGFDVLIACAFNYEAHASEFHKLGRIPVLKARMNVKTYRVDAQFTTAHMKSCVVDGDTLVAGSINWTDGGFNDVAETDLEIHGGRAPAQVEAQFASDWVQRGIPAEPPSAVTLALCKLYNKR